MIEFWVMTALEKKIAITKCECYLIIMYFTWVFEFFYMSDDLSTYYLDMV